MYSSITLYKHFSDLTHKHPHPLPVEKYWFILLQLCLIYSYTRAMIPHSACTITNWNPKFCLVQVGGFNYSRQPLSNHNHVTSCHACWLSEQDDYFCRIFSMKKRSRQRERLISFSQPTLLRNIVEEQERVPGRSNTYRPIFHCVCKTQRWQTLAW